MKTWNVERVRFLCEWWGKKPASWIGERIGVTRSAVIGRANRMKLPPSPFINGKKGVIVIRPVPEEIIEYVPAGKPFRDVGPLECRWIYGDPLKDGACCAGPTYLNSPYCLGHFLESYQQDSRPLKIRLAERPDQHAFVDEILGGQ